MLKIRGPSIKPWEKPDVIFLHILNKTVSDLTFASKPYASSLAINTEWFKMSYSYLATHAAYYCSCKILLDIWILFHSYLY